jgi:hypothetical protein
LLLIFSLAYSQWQVDKEELAKAEEKGNVLFESVLKDAVFVPLEKSIGETNVYGQWTLKFENGAVITKYSGYGGAKENMKSNIWWIGEEYVVYLKKRKAGWILVVALLEEKNKEK